MCDMTHSCVWHDSFICVTWLIHMCDVTHSYVRYVPYHSCVWCDLFCVTFNIHMENVKRINESRHTYKWVMSHIWMWHALCHIQHPYKICPTHYAWVTSHIYMSHVTHMNVTYSAWHSTSKGNMPNTGWRRPIGYLELQVIFRKRATISRALLRKITYLPI